MNKKCSLRNEYGDCVQKRKNYVTENIMKVERIMTNKEKILSEIERLRSEYKSDRPERYAAKCVLDKIIHFINSLPEEPVSDDLEEAAEVYGYTNWQSDDYHEGALFDAIGHTEKCFKDGAKWNNERVIKKACNWLKKHGGFTLGFPGAEVKDFRKYMEEEK